MPVGRYPRRRPSPPKPSDVRTVDCPESTPLASGAAIISGCGAPAGEQCRNTDGTPRAANHKARITAYGRKRRQARAVAYSPSNDVNKPYATDHYGRAHDGASGAMYGGTCPRCDESLTVGSRPVRTSRGYVHAACAPGALDDE